MKSCLPTLTLDGFVTNKRLIFYKVWEYFLSSEYSQSTTFRGMISSLKYILATVDPNDSVEISKKIEDTLNTMYRKYFDNSTVDVLIDEDPETRTLRINIAIECSDDGDETVYRLYKEVESTNGEIKKYNELLNELYAHYS